ncbi:hypothetical protein [Candidatus Fukatsuia symbiotica]
MGWQVYAEESADNASDMMKAISQKICRETTGILRGVSAVLAFNR